MTQEILDRIIKDATRKGLQCRYEYGCAEIRPHREEAPDRFGDIKEAVAAAESPEDVQQLLAEMQTDMRHGRQQDADQFQVHLLNIEVDLKPFESFVVARIATLNKLSEAGWQYLESWNRDTALGFYNAPLASMLFRRLVLLDAEPKSPEEYTSTLPADVPVMLCGVAD